MLTCVVLRRCTLSLMYCTSLVPRPHPLTRKSGVVNQVEVLGLVHTFATVSPSKVQHFSPNLLKKGMDTRVYFTAVREVLCINYQSRNPNGHYHLISPRNLTLFIRPFLTGSCAYIHTVHQDGDSSLVCEIKVT